MRSRKMLVIVAVGLVVSLAVVSKAAPMGTAWTYQGRLMDDNEPGDGLYDFQFKLFNDPCTGTQQGSTVDVNNLDVIDGYFTVELDFGSSVFNGNARWLEIIVRQGDSIDVGDYVTLSPRQELSPTPYALQTRGIFVDNSENVGIGTTNPISKLSFGTTWNPKMVALWDGVEDFYGFGTDIGRMTFYAMDSEVMTLNSLGWLGLGTPFPVGYLDITGAANAMTLVRINQTGNKQYNGLRLDREGVEKWFVGMTHTDDNLTFRRNTSSNDMVIKTDNGYVGIGTVNPQQLLHVFGLSNPRMLVEAPSNATPELNLKRGSEAWGMYIGSNAGLNFFHNGTVASLSHGGNVGIGTSSPTQKLEVDKGNIFVRGPGSFDAVGEQATVYLGNGYYYIRSEHGFGVKIGTYGVGDAICIKEPTGNVGIGTSSPAAKLDVRGKIRVSNAAGDPLVELGEGLDYAEGFDVTDEQNIQPGTLLVIDPDHPGQLEVSTEAYDRKVAGIVAGAQGLGSGVRLGNGEFDHDVALAGRVYCNVDATYNAVTPGDLLTTSDIAGYAMVVKDFSKAQGAILGKAMQSLPVGQKGQILVLVTLQ